MNNRDAFDEWIKQSLNEEMEEEIPQSQELLKNIQKEIRQKVEVRKKRKRWMRAAVVFLAVTLTCAYITTNESYSKYVRKLLKIDAREENELVLDNQNPGERESEVIEAVMTAEEIEEKYGYLIHEPNYLPNGYQQFEIMVRAYNQNILHVYIEYTGETSVHLIKFIQKPIYNNASRAKEHNKDNSIVEKIVRNDLEYIVVKDLNSNKTIILWEKEKVMYQIEGELEKEEMLKIAETVD